MTAQTMSLVLTEYSVVGGEGGEQFLNSQALLQALGGPV
jgi:hypothetical protein